MEHLPHPAVSDRLARLAPDQRSAATAPPGPVLCVAPAGSGKTTTLVARVAWLVDEGADPGSVCIVAFNKRAAEELTARLEAALEPLGVAPGAVRVRTFHALGREILLDAGVAVDPLVDRDALLRDLFVGIGAADRGRLDLAFSRLKLDLRVTADEVAADPAPGPVAAPSSPTSGRSASPGASTSTTSWSVRSGQLEADATLLARWRVRTTSLLVDEAQDLDRTQLDLALALAAPGNNVFLVGDDDQSIYGWRLADVRRVLGLAALLPGLRRVDLETNYRCPRPVIARASPAGGAQPGAVREADPAPGRRPSGGSCWPRIPRTTSVRVRRAMRTWPVDGSSRAVLARTNRELLVAVSPRWSWTCHSGHRTSRSRSRIRAWTRCWTGSTRSAQGPRAR